MRLIAEDGHQLGIVPLAEALRQAKEAGRDLVQVASEADPPVCRILDFGKFKYRQKKRLHQTHHHTRQTKEIRLHPKTGTHDVEYRLEHAREFLEAGHKVLVSIFFKGREMAHRELGEQQVNHFAQALGDIAKVEQSLKMEKRRMNILLAPKIKGGVRPPRKAETDAKTENTQRDTQAGESDRDGQD